MLYHSNVIIYYGKAIKKKKKLLWTISKRQLFFFFFSNRLRNTQDLLKYNRRRTYRIGMKIGTVLYYNVPIYTF